jgi:hypothetical protein
MAFVFYPLFTFYIDGLILGNLDFGFFFMKFSGNRGKDPVYYFFCLLVIYSYFMLYDRT